MSKILLITPIYKIVGRNELFRDTECIHDLVKKWTNKHDIYVIHIYINSIRNLFKFFGKGQLNYYFNGYNYECDNIPVTLIENQNIIMNHPEGFKISGNRFKRIIKRELDKKNLNPNIIVVHIPSLSKFFIEQLNYNCDKVAVLHYSDVKYLRKKQEKFIQFLNSNYKYVFCRSKAIYEEFKNYGLNNLKDEIIYSGVPTSVTNFDILNHKFSDSKVKILYVGKLIKRKKLDILIKALSKINSDLWHLNVIGSGSMLKKYKMLANKLKINNNINFIGSLSKKEVLNYMEKSDIFCMPSVNETLGLVYLEAMSKGCITIGTKKEGIDGIIKDGVNGYLVECDSNKLYNLIDKIIKDTSEHHMNISKNAIKTSIYYNENDMSEKYLRLIAKVINDEK